MIEETARVIGKSQSRSKGGVRIDEKREGDEGEGVYMYMCVWWWRGST